MSRSCCSSCSSAGRNERHFRRRLIMFKRLTAWIEQRRSRQAAVDRACKAFRATHRIEPMGGHVLSHDAERTIVRVMYVTDHIPPNRIWYAIAGDDIREIPFEEVAHLEGPWR